MLVTAPKTQPISAARRTAFTILQAVSEGAFASDALLDQTKHLDSRDAGLTSQIVFGCLRHQAQLDHLITLFSGRNANELDGATLVIFRTAIFQLRYLDRIPAHAAVHDAVELAKRHRRAASGLVNAVLRKVGRQPVEWPDEETELSCPAWLLERWAEHFGRGGARAIASKALEEPVPYVRVAPGAVNAHMDSSIELEPTAVEGCFRLLSALPKGMRLQDISSQAIVPLLDLQPGQSYLDLCAAPGNKTIQALETALGVAVACDISPIRIREVPPVCARVVVDASRALPFSRKFDRVFVDAPCSGTGTLSRNPEIKWRVKVQDFERFREKQIAILRRALTALAPGGKLVYATCSLEIEENEQVVQRALEGGSGVRCRRESWRLPGREEGDGFYAAEIS